MTLKAQTKLLGDAERLRRQLAEHEARADDCRQRLAVIEAKMENRPVPLSGLDELWKMAPDKARERSSKHLCRVAWRKVPPAERPQVKQMLDAMKHWCVCDEWKKEGGQFVPALDRWIKEQRWEDPPSVRAAPSRARSVAKPIQETPPEEAPTPDELAAVLQSLRLRRVNS